MFHHVAFDLRTNEATSNITIYREYHESEVILRCEIRPRSIVIGNPDITVNELRQRCANINRSLWVKMVLSSDRKNIKRLTVFGPILEQLHHIMCYGVSGAGLLVNFSMNVRVVHCITGLEITANNLISELLPTIENGLIIHKEYKGTNPSNDLFGVLRRYNGNLLSWVMSAFRVWIAGIYLDPRIYLINNDLPNNHQENIFTPVMIYYDGSGNASNPPLTISRYLLAYHCPDFYRLSQYQNFRPGSAYEIFLTGYSRDEVSAFIYFLRHGDVLIPSTNLLMAIKLLRFGHIYMVPKLKEAMKAILVSKPPQNYNQNSAERLCAIARECGEYGLEQYALFLISQFQ